MPESPGDPFVLDPAPGLPCFLTPGRDDLALLALTQLADPDLRDWMSQLALAPKTHDASVRLEPLGIDALDRCEPPAAVAAAVESSLGQLPRRLVRLRLRATHGRRGIGDEAPPRDGRRFDLYDLVRRDVRVRSRCVAIERAGDGDRLALAFASDLHVAAIWDTIDSAIARYASDLHARYLHPGRLLRRFVADANGLAARGELDLVVRGAACGPTRPRGRRGPRRSGALRATVVPQRPAAGRVLPQPRAARPRFGRRAPRGDGILGARPPHPRAAL